MLEAWLFQEDLFYFWSIGKALREGANPYDQALLIQNMRSIGLPEGYVFGGNAYPPWVLPIFALASLVPFEIMRWIWFMLQLLCVVSSAKVFVNWLSERFAFNTKQQAYLYLSVALLVPLIESVLRWGQLGAFGLVGIAGYFHYQRRNRSVLAALSWSLAAIKPHLLFPFLLVTFYQSTRSPALARTKWLFPVVALTPWLFLAALSLTLRADIFADYISLISKYSGELVRMRLSSIGHILRMYSGIELLRWAPLILATALLIVTSKSSVKVKDVAGDSQLAEHSQIFWLIPLSLSVAPYAWGNDMQLLLPSYLLLAAIALSKSSSLMFGFILLMAMLYGFADLISFEYRAVIAWVVLLLVTWAKCYPSEDRAKADYQYNQGK